MTLLCKIDNGKATINLMIAALQKTSLSELVKQLTQDHQRMIH